MLNENAKSPQTESFNPFVHTKNHEIGQAPALTGHILVVDDEAEMLSFLQRFLTADGHRVTACSCAAEALDKLKPKSPNGNGEQTINPLDVDMVLSDVNMPQMNGITLTRHIKDLIPELPVVLITAFGSIESAVDAIKRGAYDYVTKPFTLADLRATVARTLEFRRLERENSLLRKEVRRSWTIGDMIGKSQQMRAVFDLVRRVSQVNSNVLILGESGTGKEMVARAIHNEGPRAKKPFVAINCAAIPENLLESEFFGHAKGSFTGAVAQKRGLFEEADGGTLFLDEIADMSIALQSKLLRVLQERKIRPVGQNTFKNIDIRIIAATHKDLKKAIGQGNFREDLYYRLCVIPIALPPLRERVEDIPVFAEIFLRKFADAHNSSVKGFSKAAMDKLMKLPWEGNVRQLENAIERAIILCDEDLIGEQHISFLNAQAVGNPDLENIDPENLSLREMEKRCLELALQRAGGKKERAAQLLGISRKTFYRKEREYGLCKTGPKRAVQDESKTVEAEVPGSDSSELT